MTPPGTAAPTTAAAAAGVSPVVDVLASVVAPASVLDLRTADAGWALDFCARGVVDVLLVRPPHHPALASSDAEVIAHDLRRPLVLDRRYDLAVAVGTGEHLPAGAAPALVRTLVDAAEVVAFASAIPGLAPPGTSNARWPSWWDGLFADLGYAAHDVIRPLLWEDDEVDAWIRQSIVLYAPPGRFSDAPLPPRLQRSVVHPEAYHRAVDDAEARRAAEAELASERALQMEAEYRRLGHENELLAGDLRALRRRPAVDPAHAEEAEAARERARREHAMLRAGCAAAERDLAGAPSPEQLVAATRQRLGSSIVRSLTAALPVRRRLRRLVGPAALLWDEAFYVTRTPDVLGAPLSPLWHYRRHGAGQRRSPHPWFDTEWYAVRNADLVARGQDPVEHYLRRGWREGRDPHPLFATRWYGRVHADPDGWRRTPLEHYLERGRAAGLPPHPLFDTPWYLDANPDVAAAGVDAVDHFCRRGWREGRDPHPLFDVGWYLETYPDVAGAGVNPLVHYLWFGWGEGRDPHPLFDTPSYLAADPDVVRSGVDPLSHYLTVGAAAGASTGRFDTAWYVQQHPEAADGGRNPLVFFVERGRARGDATLPPTDGAEGPPDD